MKNIEKLIAAMDEAGYTYDELESTPGWLHFFGEYGTLSFDSHEDLEGWLNGVVFEDPEVDDKVWRIMHE